MVNVDSSVPFYVQVKEDILNKIHSGELLPGSRLASEKELTQQYGVSTITIRRAVSELVDENVLERKQGKGTFVLQRNFQRNFSQTGMGFSEICEANGMAVSTLVLNAEVVNDPPEEILEQLELPKGFHVVYIRRLRYADQQPVVIETTYFPMHYAYLLDIDLAHDSMYRTLRTHEENFCPYNQFGQRKIRLISADKETASLLRIKLNSTILFSDSVVYDEGTGKPVHTSTHVGYAQKYNFTMQV